MCTDDVFVEARLERRGTPCRPAKRLCGTGTILRTSPLGPLVTRDARPGHRMCRLALHNKQWLVRLGVTNFLKQLLTFTLQL